ncbi:MAG: cupin domain-containing protein [Candidatus Sulfotelmatobacter sp.]
MLRRQLFFLTCLLCFASSAVLAQDVLKVAGGPETHKVVLDNDEVRMLDARVQPGQKVAMHSHPPNTVYYMTDCKLKVTAPDGKTQIAESKAATAIWRGETKHAVENVGTAECHLVQTELKEKK